MTIPEILLPVFVQVALILGLAFWMAYARTAAGKRGEIKRQSGGSPWPEPVKLISDSYSNQFEAPVLFFALVPLTILTRKADLLFVVLEWLFVLSRLLHAGVHTTSNYIPWRGAAFGIGLLILTLMWIIFAVRILSVTAIG